MSTNPFEDKSPLNSLLTLDLCQRIHFEASRAAARGVFRDAIPDPIVFEGMMKTASFQGISAYFLHPDSVKYAFAGVTLAVYRKVESLFCSHEKRSIRTVWNILERIARSAGVTPISYEAIWAICVHLARRREEFTVLIERQETEWTLNLHCPDVVMGSANFKCARPHLITISNPANSVLAFRITDRGELEENTLLALYDAVISCRQPRPRTPGGLTWNLPIGVIVDKKLENIVARELEQIGIAVQGKLNGPIPDSITDGKWWADLANRTYSQNELTTLFDTYLEKVHGYGPWHQRNSKERSLVDLIGYNLDPAWVFPELRNFLPAYGGIIKNSIVEHDGLHYADEILSFYEGGTVKIRISEAAESTAWIYLGDEILCQAMACELRRTDGSYRSNRQGR